MFKEPGEAGQTIGSSHFGSRVQGPPRGNSETSNTAAICDKGSWSQSWFADAATIDAEHVSENFRCATLFPYVADDHNLFWVAVSLFSDFPGYVAGLGNHNIRIEIRWCQVSTRLR